MKTLSIKTSNIDFFYRVKLILYKCTYLRIKISTFDLYFYNVRRHIAISPIIVFSNAFRKKSGRAPSYHIFYVSLQANQPQHKEHAQTISHHHCYRSYCTGLLVHPSFCGQKVCPYSCRWQPCAQQARHTLRSISRQTNATCPTHSCQGTKQMTSVSIRIIQSHKYTDNHENLIYFIHCALRRCRMHYILR